MIVGIAQVGGDVRFQNVGLHRLRHAGIDDLAQTGDVDGQHQVGGRPVTLGLQPFGQGLPLGQGQHQAEMGHGHQGVADMAGAGGGKGLAPVQRQLVAEKIEIHPGRGGAAFGAAHGSAIEMARLIEVADVDGQVEQALHGRQA